MTIQQTIEIPADRRVYLDLPLPETTPMGRAEVQITITLASAPKREMSKLGMFTAEQLKTLIDAEVPEQPKNWEVLERREAWLSLTWQHGKSRKEHSLFKYAGCLKDSGIFDGDSMDIQREMRREWER